LLFFIVSYTINSQTIVGTTPENKNVVLEEFTGIHCGYCPQGHAIAQGIKDAHPDDVFLINIHVGGYANPSAGEPDFRTTFGTAIVGQTGLIGYPAGTINRHYFPGTSQGTDGTTAQSRNNWSTTSNQVLTESSYVNIAAETSLDVITRELIVHVEAYYTADSPESTNMLNVALLQDNTKGPQAGGNAGNDYIHMHRLVHMLTGQWGEEITTTATGTFVDRTFVYTIPNDYNGEYINFGNLKVVAFIAETHQEIVTGIGESPTYLNMLANEVEILSVSDIDDNCTGIVAPQFKIVNSGTSTLTSLDIEYLVNGGGTNVYTWTGSLESYATQTIDLPAVPFTLQAVNTLNITIADDDNTANNYISTTFEEVVTEATHATITIELQQDKYGSETTWELVNDTDGSVLLSGGPYVNNNSPELITESIVVGASSCYSFKIYDSYGDGICCTHGNGYYNVKSGDNLLFTGGDFGKEEVKGFKTTAALGVEDNDLFATTQIYPNPANTEINVVNAEGFKLELFDVLGRLVYSSKSISTDEKIDVTNLGKGTYFIKISNDKASRIEKIFVN